MDRLGSWQSFGVVAGAPVAALPAPRSRFKKIKSLKRVIATILEGLLMGYGARLAGGRNIGVLFSAVGSMSVSDWVFMFFLLIGTFIESGLLAKFLV